MTVLGGVSLLTTFLRPFLAQILSSLAPDFFPDLQKQLLIFLSSFLR
jgi:hypothetical protein